MSLKEIRELLVLTEWSREELAQRLGLSLNTVQRWFCRAPEQRRVPGVAECTLMRQWLDQARASAQASSPEPASAG